jgi:hypothetical protein
MGFTQAMKRYTGGSVQSFSKRWIKLMDSPNLLTSVIAHNKRKVVTLFCQSDFSPLSEYGVLTPCSVNKMSEAK